MRMNRRQFIQSALAVAGASSLPIMASPSSSSAHLDVRAVSIAWKKANLPPYDIYLHQHGVLRDAARLAQRIKDDFTHLRTLSVDGMVLSVTESAMLLHNHA